jgi:hypothetical protein
VLLTHRNDVITGRRIGKDYSGTFGALRLIVGKSRSIGYDAEEEDLSVGKSRSDAELSLTCQPGYEAAERETARVASDSQYTLQH